MKSISNLFYRKSNLALVIIFTALAFGYLYLVMMDKAACFALQGEEGSSLAISFGFTQEVVKAYFEARSSEMLSCFSDFNRIWDNVFALLYGVMYVVWLSLLFKPLSNKLGILNLFPLLQTIFDFIENFSLQQLANQHLVDSTLSSTIVQVASGACMAKWIVSTIVMMALLVGVVYRVYKYINRSVEV